MAQYWLQTPIENAKEVVQRFISTDPNLFPGYVGKKVEYDVFTEVIIYNLTNYTELVYPNIIYFGTFFLANTDPSARASVNDGVTDVYTFDVTLGVFEPGAYPYIIWNRMDTQFSSNSYFVGYRFQVV